MSEVDPVMVIGASGMLGRAVCEALTAAELKFGRPGPEELDLTSRGSIGGAVLSGYCRTVINCAAYTDVDGAETNVGAAKAVNAKGPMMLAEACESSGTRLVHVSTDYVFGGKAKRPYPVTGPVSPRGVYATTKAVGEKAVREASKRNLIVRTSWLYAPWGNNFVRTMAALTRDRDELKVVHDQRGTPTSAQHLANVMVMLLRGKASGTFHVTDGGECTWYELACAVRDGLGHECAIKPCTTEEFPRPAPRPAYSVLDVSTTEDSVGKMPGWRSNLAGVLERLETY